MEFFGGWQACVFCCVGCGGVCRRWHVWRGGMERNRSTNDDGLEGMMDAIACFIVLNDRHCIRQLILRYPSTPSIITIHHSLLHTSLPLLIPPHHHRDRFPLLPNIQIATTPQSSSHHPLTPNFTPPPPPAASISKPTCVRRRKRHQGRRPDPLGQIERIGGGRRGCGGGI